MAYLEAERRRLERLRKKRNDPLYQQMASFLIKKQAPEFRYRGRQFEEYLKREDAPESAKAQALIGQQQKWSEIVSGAVEPARLKEEQRRKALEGRIEEGEYRIDVMEEQKEEQEEARKRNFYKNLLKGLGTVAGVALAAPTGGMSMGLGAALGGLAGSVAGEVAYGKEYYEPAGIMQGMTDIAFEIATSADLKLDEAMGTKLGEYSDIVRKMTTAGVSDEEIGNLLFQAKMNQTIMLPQQYMNWLDDVFGVYYSKGLEV